MLRAENHRRLDEHVAGLVQRCRDLFRHDPLVFDAGPEAISTLGIISGAADKALHQAIDQGLDIGNGDGTANPMVWLHRPRTH